MMMTMLNRVCYTICIFCIITGVVLSLMIIWSDTNDVVLWRGLGTVCVFFAGAALALSVNRVMFTLHRRDDE